MRGECHSGRRLPISNGEVTASAALRRGSVGCHAQCSARSGKTDAGVMGGVWGRLEHQGPEQCWRGASGTPGT